MSELSKIYTDKAVVTSLFEPAGTFFKAQMVAKSQKFLGNKNLPPGYLAGFGFGFDENTARIKAVAEFFERYFAETITKEIFKFSINHAQDLGLSLVNPNHLRPYHESAFIEARFPKVKENEPISFTMGQDFFGNPYFLPARAVFLPFISQEPAFMSISATGTAAHVDKKSAQENALLEIIERHALMASFRLKNHVWSLDVPDDLKEFLAQNQLELRLFDVGQKIPVVMAIISRGNDEITIGSKAGPLNLSTIKAAVAEALSTRISLMKGAKVLGLPRSSFEHMKKAFHDDRIIKFYENKSIKKPVFNELFCFDAINEEIGPIYFADIGQHEQWHVVRAIALKAYSKEGDSLYPHYKNFLTNFSVDELNIEPHPFG